MAIEGRFCALEIKYFSERSTLVLCSPDYEEKCIKRLRKLPDRIYKFRGIEYSE